MSGSAIIGKIRGFLKKHMPPNEECHVIYLLLEIRKLLDRESNGKYRLLRFYADWCVHTSKDRNAPIKDMMESIYKEIRYCADKGLAMNKERNLTTFLSMEGLKKELERFLHYHDLPTDLITERKNWTDFQTLLVSILVDQPIVKPCDGIKHFSFTVDTKGQALAEIEYEKKPPEYITFTFGGIHKMA